MDEVISNGKTIQMSLLPKHSDNLERLQTFGQRESEAQEVQKLWQEVHDEGEKSMMDKHSSFNKSFGWDHPGQSVRNMERIRQLRTFERATKEKLAELEEECPVNAEMISQERATIEMTRKEIRSLERILFYTEFGE